MAGKSFLGILPDQLAQKKEIGHLGPCPGRSCQAIRGQKGLCHQGMCHGSMMCLLSRAKERDGGQALRKQTN